MGLEVGERAGDVVMRPGDEARFCVLGSMGDGILTGDDKGRGLMIRIGLLLGDSAKASKVYEVSMTRLGVEGRFGLPNGLPLNLLVFKPSPNTGTRLGLPNGETIGETCGVHGVLGVPGVRVSELTAEVIVRGLDGEANESKEDDPATAETMDGGRSLLSSVLSKKSELDSSSRSKPERIIPVGCVGDPSSCLVMDGMSGTSWSFSVSHEAMGARSLGFGG